MIEVTWNCKICGKEFSTKFRTQKAADKWTAITRDVDCYWWEETREQDCKRKIDNKKLLEISKRMQGQDNRITAHPIFVVQQKQRIYGLDHDHAEDYEGEIGYKDIWEFVQPFFSDKAAQEYITANRHHLNNPRVYVDSAYRNKEWQAVREVLVGMEETKE